MIIAHTFQKCNTFFKVYLKKTTLHAIMNYAINVGGKLMVSKDAKGISERIKELRGKKDFTLEAWGALFGKNKSSAYKWENGTIPYMPTLIEMARICEVYVEWILYGESLEYLKAVLGSFKIFENFIDNDRLMDYINEELKKEKKEYNNNEIVGKLISSLLASRDEAMPFSLSIDEQAFFHKDKGWYEDEELQKFLDDNNIELRDLNVRNVDNFPAFRFDAVNKIERNLTKMVRTEMFENNPVIEPWNREGFGDVDNFHIWKNFFDCVAYLETTEYLLTDFVTADEASRINLTPEQRIMSSIHAENTLLSMVFKYRELRDEVMEEHNIDDDIIDAEQFSLKRKKSKE